MLAVSGPARNAAKAVAAHFRHAVTVIAGWGHDMMYSLVEVLAALERDRINSGSVPVRETAASGPHQADGHKENKRLRSSAKQAKQQPGRGKLGWR